jgi:hypothetical protein
MRSLSAGTGIARANTCLELVQRTMGKLTLSFAALFLVGSIFGCSDIQQQIVAAARQPGDHVATTPQQLWKESICNTSDRPSVKVESLEVLPEKVKPGGRVNYRLTYAMCPVNKFSETLAASTTRTISYKGQEVARNSKEAFELKAGRWTVDSFFTLPRESPLGVYALEVAVQTPRGETQKLVRSFVVSNEFHLSGE